jgi:hypothetical protein
MTSSTNGDGLERTSDDYLIGVGVYPEAVEPGLVGSLVLSRPMPFNTSTMVSRSSQGAYRSTAPMHHRSKSVLLGIQRNEPSQTVVPVVRGARCLALALNDTWPPLRLPSNVCSRPAALTARQPSASPSCPATPPAPPAASGCTSPTTSPFGRYPDADWSPGGIQGRRTDR